MKPADQFRLLELSERYADQKLNASEVRTLEEQLRGSAEARAFFAQALHQRAELCFDDSWHSQDAAPATARPPKAGWWRYAATAAAAACVTFGLFWLQGGRDETVATLMRSQQCQWAGSSLPTVEGARLKPGTLDLIEGLAVLRFDSGAELVLEAPATVEVLDAMNCRLRRGTLVAEVPPQAKGFSIDTKEAKVIDWGTKFGVSADADGKYMVRVLEGLVEVDGKDGSATKKLEKGEGVDRGWSRSQLNPGGSDGPEPSRWQPSTVIDAGDGWQAITTAFGHGKDSYIQPTRQMHTDFGKHPFLRVKHSGEAKPELNRKGYIAFDLTKFAGREIEDAELVLTIEPSELGFASFVPDSTFAVYGLLDENEDGWAEDELTWKDAPAHDPEQAERHLPVASKVRLLGRFEIAQGINRGTRKLRGKDLAGFLNADTNKMVTLVICRETSETADSGLVHAFATKENDTRSAPMLRVKVR